MSRPPRAVAFADLTGLLAFGFGSGLSRWAPGTAGSLAALPFGIGLAMLPSGPALLMVAAAFAIGIHVCGEAARRLQTHDHPGIVWDEFVGLWLVLIFVPLHWHWWLAAFGLFRLFDIAKPWPIRWADRRVRGGLGIMLDDVLAAGYTLLVLLVARHLING